MWRRPFLERHVIGNPFLNTDTRSSSTWDAILTTASAALQVEIFGNSSGTNYKLDHITYANAISFHSSLPWFMSNVTLKWYALHEHTLYFSIAPFYLWHCPCISTSVFPCGVSAHICYVMSIKSSAPVYFSVFLFSMSTFVGISNMLLC
jgi:hypothetical protein